MSWCALRGSRKWRWKSMSGASSRFRWHEGHARRLKLPGPRLFTVRTSQRLSERSKLNTNSRADFRAHVGLLGATKAALLLSLLFLAVYGGSNWLTAHRPHVGSLFFEWERFIPFIPIMVLPYMSIDLFFLAAPFFCRTKAELSSLTGRISLAIIASGICFLLFPLRFGFERPAVSGWLGTIFNTFRTLDQPYNLVPS